MKRIKPSRIISLLFCLTLLLGNLSVMGIAAEPDEMPAEESVNTVSVNTAPVLELPDNPELFAAFVESELYSYDIAVFGTAARASLNPIGQKIYDALKSKIETVALNGGSTVFMLSEIDGLKTTWTNTELGVASIEDVTIVEAAFTSQFDLNAIVTALLNDCPFDLYWYDKTFGVGMDYQIGRSGYHDGSSVVWNSASVEHLSFTFTVAVDYMSGQDAVTTDVSKILIAKNNAAQVVAANAAKTDYEKLVAYKDYICQQVSYNYSAAENIATPYGDPWQMISVFDADESTNVVCEGYSKAFMYLCDLSSFTDDTACYTVTGQMDGGNHMWNIVTLDEENYLVDVTNSDDGAVGQYGGLFLAGGTGSVTEGYIVDGNFYAYDSLTLSQWGTDAESILWLADENYDSSESSGVCGHIWNESLKQCTLCGVTGGYCGDLLENRGHNMFWTWDTATRTLTISGNGTMEEYSLQTPAPWQDLKNNIELVVVDEGIIVIGGSAFRDCVNMAGIELPDSLSEIGMLAFHNCKLLKTIELPDSLAVIGSAAFESSGLTAIEIPYGVQVIDQGVFAYCKSLKAVDIAGSVNEIMKGAFFGCSNLESLSLHEGLEIIGFEVFYDCDKLTEVAIPESVTEIHEWAFEECDGLTSIAVSKHVTYLGDSAFHNCKSLTGIWVDEENSYYSSDSFGVLFDKEKAKLMQVPGGITGSYSIPDGVTTIKSLAFYNCQLDAVIVSKDVSSIEPEAFAQSGKLRYIVLPAGLMTVGDYAFYGCNNLWHILYTGTQWDTISIGEENNPLYLATHHDQAVGNEITASQTETCTERELFICTICSDILLESIPGGQHEWITATCTKPGICKTCGATEGTALSHDMGDWETTKEPSTTEEGEKERTCKREGCSYKETEKLPVLEKALWQVSFANMSLSNSLAMNFAFAQSNEADWTGYYAVITKTYADGRPDVEVKIPAAQWGTAKINGVAHYTISFKGIAVKEMGDEIHVRIYNSEGKAVSSVWTDTARDYALRAYKAANATQKEKRMLIDMLNYGAAAQQMFKYDKEHLVTAGLTDEQKAMATQQVEAISNLEKGANYLGTNLTLESEIRMNVAFKNVTKDMYAKVSLTNHAGRVINETAQMDLQGSTGIVRVNQIAVADGRTMVTITVYNADGSIHGSAVDSLEGYIFRASNNEPEVAKLYEKILMFADSTYNFKH